VCGGIGSVGQDLSSVERFDAYSESWDLFPRMLMKRHSASAVVVSNKLYIFGGCNRHYGILNSVECLSMGLLSWTASSLMPDRRAGAVALVTLW